MNKKDIADIGTEVKSITLDSSGKPEWVLNSDGTVVLSESFVESGAIKRA